MEKIKKSLEELILEEIRTQHNLELVPEQVRAILQIEDFEQARK